MVTVGDMCVWFLMSDRLHAMHDDIVPREEAPVGPLASRIPDVISSVRCYTAVSLPISCRSTYAVVATECAAKTP